MLRFGQLREVVSAVIRKPFYEPQGCLLRGRWHPAILQDRREGTFPYIMRRFRPRFSSPVPESSVVVGEARDGSTLDAPRASPASARPRHHRGMRPSSHQWRLRPALPVRAAAGRELTIAARGLRSAEGYP